MSAKALTRSEHFRSFTGSSATRANSRGDCEFSEVELQPTMIAQLAAICEGKGTDHEAERIGGSYRKTLHNEQRAAFEAIFVEVAAARLPKQHFLALVEEARSIWRGEFSGLVPPDWRHIKKLRRRTKAEA